MQIDSAGNLHDDSGRFASLRHAGPGYDLDARRVVVEHDLIDPPRWPSRGDLDTSGIPVVGHDEAGRDHAKQMVKVVFDSAALEGNPFTREEVATLVDGRDVDGRSAQAVAQVQGLIDAVQIVQADAWRDARILGKAFSDRLNLAISRSGGVPEPGRFRGEGSVQGGGDVEVPGDEVFLAIQGFDRLRGIYDQGLDRLNSDQDVVARALTYAAFSAYYQFYPNGNKRTGQYMATAHLLSHGYRAVHVPSARQRDYVRALVRMWRTGDLAPYAQFLLSLARRD